MFLKKSCNNLLDWGQFTCSACVFECKQNVLLCYNPITVFPLSKGQQRFCHFPSKGVTGLLAFQQLVQSFDIWKVIRPFSYNDPAWARHLICDSFSSENAHLFSINDWWMFRVTWLGGRNEAMLIQEHSGCLYRAAQGTWRAPRLRRRLSNHWSIHHRISKLRKF